MHLMPHMMASTATSVAAGSRRSLRGRFGPTPLCEGWLVVHNPNAIIWKASKRWFTLRTTSHQLYVLEQAKAERSTESLSTLDLSLCTVVRCQDPAHFLSIGSPVFVPRYGHGILRFLGPRDKVFDNVVAGVELKLPLGNCTGLQNDHRYFNCSEKHGILVSVDELRPLDQNGNPLTFDKGSKFALEVGIRSRKANEVETFVMHARSFGDLQRWVFALSKAVFEGVPKAISMKLPPSIRNADWYHGAATRAQAETQLFNCESGDGVFLVRRSTSEPTSLVISIRNNDSVSHVLIVMSQDLVQSIGSTEEMADRVSFSINGKITQVDSFEALLIYLMEPREVFEWTTPLRCFISKSSGSNPEDIHLVPMSRSRSSMI
eukprot:m.141116 g.141116  ORF g.141116 m.141116 type:complete len:376 (+) comp16685_c0_seq3:518-1645(+)